MGNLGLPFITVTEGGHRNSVPPRHRLHPQSCRHELGRCVEVGIGGCDKEKTVRYLLTWPLVPVWAVGVDSLVEVGVVGGPWGV